MRDIQLQKFQILQQTMVIICLVCCCSFAVEGLLLFRENVLENKINKLEENIKSYPKYTKQQNKVTSESGNIIYNKIT